MNKKQSALDRAAALSNKVTPRQVQYLQILLNDCGFGSLMQRDAYLSRETGRKVTAVADLTFDEGRRLIEVLKARKEGVEVPSYNDDSEDDE